MNIFNCNQKTYLVSSHAKKRMYERGKFEFNEYDETENKCLELISTGELLLETELFRYIKNDDFFFPCKIESKNKYIVTTILRYDDMVKDRFQNIVDMYN